MNFFKRKFHFTNGQNGYATSCGFLHDFSADAELKNHWHFYVCVNDAELQQVILVTMADRVVW